MIEYLLCLSAGFAAGFAVAWSFCSLAWKRVQMNLIADKRDRTDRLSAEIDRLIELEYQRAKESNGSKHI